MKRPTKIAMLVAGAIIVLGVVISVIAVSLGALDQKGLNSGAYKEKNYTFDLSIVKGLDVSDIDSDISVSRSGDGKVRVVCWENDKDYYNVTMSTDGKLHINRIIGKKWYDFLVITTEIRRSALQIYLPSDIDGEAKLSAVSGRAQLNGINVNGSLTVNTTSGKISLSGVSVKGKCNLTSVSGDMELASVTSGPLSLRTTSGRVNASNSAVSGDLGAVSTSGMIGFSGIAVSGDVSAETVSGGVRLDAVKGNNFTIKTTSGDVSGYISGSPSDYRIDAKSTSGRLNLPRSQNGAKFLRINTVSGSVDLDIK